MQAVQNTVDQFMEKADKPNLRECLVKFADYSLNNFQNDLLTKALMLSKALAEFQEAWEDNLGA